jgi:hypothetical protein
MTRLRITASLSTCAPSTVLSARNSTNHCDSGHPERCSKLGILFYGTSWQPCVRCQTTLVRSTVYRGIHDDPPNLSSYIKSTSLANGRYMGRAAE